MTEYNLFKEIAILTGSMLMIWFSVAVLIVSQYIYGSEISLVWTSGVLFIIALNFLIYSLYSKKQNMKGGLKNEHKK